MIYTGLFPGGLAIVAFLVLWGLVPLTVFPWTGWVMTGATAVQFAFLWSRGMSRWIGSKADGAQGK